MANTFLHLKLIYFLFISKYTSYGNKDRRDCHKEILTKCTLIKKNNLECLHVIPGHMQVSDAAWRRKRLQRQICSCRLLQLPLTYLYAAKTFYVSESCHLWCAKNTFKLLPCSSESHETDKILNLSWIKKGKY